VGRRSAITTLSAKTKRPALTFKKVYFKKNQQKAGKNIEKNKMQKVHKMSTNRSCGLETIKYCANLPLARIGVQVPAWLAPMTDKQSLLPARAGRIN
jgi:hypothetical protein